jgi:polar amino acid transport system substrate-binding protein
MTLSLYLNHHIMDLYKKQIEVNQTWADWFGSYSELGQLASQPNLNNTNFSQQKGKRLDSVVYNLNSHMAAAKDDLTESWGSQKAMPFLKSFIAMRNTVFDLTKVVRATKPDADAISEQEMDKEPVHLAPGQSRFAHEVNQAAGQSHLAKQIPAVGRSLDKQKPSTEANAKIDNKYMQVTQEMANVSRLVAMMQHKNTENQMVLVGSVEKLEYVVASLILLMVGAATIYGYRLARRLELDELEKHQMITDLERAESRTRAILDTAVDGIVTIDDNGIINSANRATERFLGFSEKELVGRKISEFIPGLTDDSRSLYRELYALRRDTSTFPVEFLTSEVRIDDKLMLTGIIRDISEQKSKEQEIKQLNEDLERRVLELAKVNAELQALAEQLSVARDQALEVSNLKSEFVARISHEIRTPISGVLGMIELLMDSKLNHEQRELVELLHDSAKSLLTIINDILDFSKIEAGKVELESIDFSPLKLVEGCAELLSSNARDKNLLLNCYVDPALPALLTGDPLRLRQILLNLASNAIKFTHTGHVALKAQLIKETKNQIFVRFSIIDTGIGLSSQACKKLFQPFVQADGSTSRKYGGTGLGLAICKRITELMDGEIGIESQEGSGSTFWFQVPLKSSASKDTTTPLMLGKETLRGKRVLLIEKSPLVQETLNNYLEALGLYVNIETSSAAGIINMRTAASLTHAYDAVILGLPIMDIEARSFMRMVESEPMLKRSGIIHLARVEDKSIRSLINSGTFAGHLLQPIRQEHLVQVLQETFKNLKNPILTTSEESQMKTDTTSVFDQALPVVLVAEDNPVLQELAMRQLKKLGVVVHTVSNGMQALEAVTNYSYALVLMDCQMPEMNGFDATTAIRKLEAGTGVHTPIIAMTANAMQGDKENCLAVGMDDYLSKPISQQQLQEALNRWLPNRKDENEKDKFSSAALIPSGPPVSIQRLEEIFGPGEHYQELIEPLVHETQSLMKRLKMEIAKHNTENVTRLCHQIRGLSVNMAAKEVTDLCTDLNDSVRSTEPDNSQNIEQLFQKLSKAVDSVSEYVDTLSHK